MHQSKLEAFVKAQGGPSKLGAKVGVGNPAVRAWLRGDSLPGPVVAVKVLQLARGKLTWKDIVTYKASKKRVKKYKPKPSPKKAR